MRTIWIAEQRRREEKRAKDPQSYPCVVEEEDDFEEARPAEQKKETPSRLEDMVDEVAQQEDAEMEALLSMLETDAWEPPANKQQLHEESNTPYGSDDDEYDQLFMEINIDEANGGLPSQPVQVGSEGDHDMMDMS